MVVTQKDIEHCAKLAHISLNNENVELLRQEMTKILDHAKNLDQLDLDFVTPYTHSSCVTLPRRIDSVRSDLFAQREALANSPQANGGCFLVPKMV